MNGKKIRIALAGGGTGGHIYPLIAVAAALQAQAQASNISMSVHYFGANDRFRRDIEGQGIKFHSLLTGKLRRYASILTLIDIPKFFLGLVQAFFKMYALMPDVVFSKGGPGALPIVLAGWFYKIPIVIHESDSVPGLTTMLTARFAKKIGVSFEQTTHYFNPAKFVLTGNPIRQFFFESRIPQEEAKSKLGFDPAKPLIFVAGGSQGAVPLNQFIILCLGTLLPIAQVLHQTGAENFVENKKLAEAELVQLPTAVSTQSRYQTLGYLSPEETKDALNAADIILSRAGSSSIFEAAAFGKPTILVPLRSAARNHQRENAQAFAKLGGGLVIEEENLHANIFTAQVQHILSDAGVREAMSRASAAFAKPEAAKTLAAIILELA